MIEFDEATHTYKVDGEIKPSQSEIVRYFFRDEHMPPQHILDYAAEKGKAIHKAIELYEKDDLGELPAWIEPYLEQWKLFRRSMSNNIVIQEKYLYCPTFNFCGRIDMVFSHGLILDVKSGQKSIKHKLQTAMYHLLAVSNNILSCSRACLYIKEDKFDLEWHKDDEDLNTAIAMTRIFHWARKNKLIKNGQ